jgi:hypothetical protein
LDPYSEYHWAIAQEKPRVGLLQSEVRSFRTGAQQLRGKLALPIAISEPVRPGGSLTATLALRNLTEREIRLFAPTRTLFLTEVRRAGPLGSTVVQPFAHPGPTDPTVTRIGPGDGYVEVHTMLATDAHNEPLRAGRYVLRVRCTAPDFAAVVDAEFPIS